MSISVRRQALFVWIVVLVFFGGMVLLGPFGCDGKGPSGDGQIATDGGGQGGDGGASDKQTSTEPTVPPKAEAAPSGCHPLAQGDGGCFLPFPSSYYLVKDSKTGTGLRLAIPDQVLPVSHRTEDSKIPFDPKPFNQRDGFSPATSIIVLFPERVDPSNLPRSGDLAKSLLADSPVQLIEFGTHKRVPLFAEVDRTVKDQEPQVLLIRPMIRLKPKTRYAVVLLKSLKALGGKPLTVSPVYLRLASGGVAKTPAEARYAPLLQETLKEIDDAGLKRDNVLMTWDFTTASDDPLLDQMISMRDQMLKQLDGKGPNYKIDHKYDFTKEQKPHILRIVQGTFEVPSFLDKDSPGGTLLLDADGKPKIRGTGKFFFQLHIPRCALTKQGPIPVMQFGHGLFGGAQGEMDSGYERQLIDRLCMVQIGHDWIGLAADDRGYVGASVLPNFNNLARLVNRLQQAHVNAIALTQLVMHRLAQDDALKVHGKPIIDGKEIYYLGISNGAIQGGTFMALSPDITRGVLNVGGGPWSMMMSRSSNFAPLFVAMKVFYKNAAERQLLIAMSQSFFDIVDPLTYAPYLVKDPGRLKVPTKHVIIQESIGDAQVPNITTRMWARTMQIPALKELAQPVFGLVLKDGPIDTSAYTQFDVKPTPMPKDENVPAVTNAAHEGARRTEGAIKQMEAFFKPDGKIQHFCKGPCDPD